MGYQTIGPSFWRGEEGRQALIAGTQRLTDETWLAPFRELALWKQYLPPGFETQTYSKSQNLFILGRAAIYPAVSSEIGVLSGNATFALGAFPAPALNAGDKCYVTEHGVLGLALNTASPNPEAARKFLTFVASGAFGELLANAMPGYFPASGEVVAVDDPLAAQFAEWRSRCEATGRLTDGVLNQGTPSLEMETAGAVVQVIKGAETPEAVAARLQAGLDSWYKPGK
jgi:raffinose/stachyose/melibiose transport system substrate-binding protein